MARWTVLLCLLIGSSIPALAHDETRPCLDVEELFASRAERESPNNRLEVQILDASTGDRLPGTSLWLCRGDARSKVTQKIVVPPVEKCISQVAARDGVGHFDGIEPGTYVLRAFLDGFAQTLLGPLHIGTRQPIAPKRVSLLLNPVLMH